MKTENAVAVSQFIVEEAVLQAESSACLVHQWGFMMDTTSLRQDGGIWRLKIK